MPKLQKQFSDSEKAYIVKHYPAMTTDKIASFIGVSTTCIRNFALRSNLNKTKNHSQKMCEFNSHKAYKQRSEYNPEPVTDTTEMLICRWDYEGMSHTEIRSILSRPSLVVEGVIAECKENGMYDFYNEYGR